MANIEFIEGNESHSSYWGKFYIKGLEDFEVREDFDGEIHDNHHSYTGWVCNNLPEGQIFTIFEQNGNKRGTDTFIFAICIAGDAEFYDWKPQYGSGFIRGNFKLICKADSKTKAPRLMDWWTKGDGSLAYAQHCAAHIDKRGLKELPPMPKAPQQEEEKVRLIYNFELPQSKASIIHDSIQATVTEVMKTEGLSPTELGFELRDEE